MSDSKNTNMTTEERYNRIYPEGIKTTYPKNTEGKIIIPNLKSDNKKTNTEQARESAKKQSSQKRKKEEMRKKTITKFKIAIAIITMTAGALAANQFIKVNKGKESLRQIGNKAMPTDEYSINSGEYGFTVYDIKNNREATYGDYINAIRSNAIEQNLDEISVYLATEENLGKIAAQDVYGKKYTNEEITDAALAYLDSLEETEEKGRGGK